MELFHKRKGFHPVDLNRMALRCMEQGGRQGINRIYAPNDFVIMLHPSDYQEISPFLHTIRSEILQELKITVADRNYLLAGELTLKLKADDTAEEGKPMVRGRMSGKDEPDSVVKYEKEYTEPPSDGQDADATNKTGSNVILSDSLTTLEEGVTVLREGNPERAMEVLSGIRKDACNVPQYHAVMGVCHQLLDHADEAKEHYSQLQDMQPDVSSALLLGYDGLSSAPDEKKETKTQKKSAGYRLEANIAGVSLVIRDNELILENRYRDPAASVDGKVTEAVVIERGNVVTLGTVRLHVMNEK